MDRAKIKNYAPKARREFREAVKGRLTLFGIRQDEGSLVVEPPVKEGDSVLIGGRAYPQSVGAKRDKLEQAVKKDGFEQTVERLAYTWFNRLVAIRYMELHGYLDHGYRVLSHPEGKPTPEILEHAEHVELQGLDRERVVDLKIEGNKDEALYRLLLIAQCNALHSALPFLFERVDDETDLALPANLLHSDSLIRKLVNEVDEDDWQEVEIIGWLYEAYISERYEAVIGKVVASEDIPAATQRFTPKWIVRYLVQNTLGRTWLATYPESLLRQQMKHYIEPAEQTPEVQEQLKAITPTSLNPEELTFLDPACGSGHVLVEAYDLFKAIYQERGYRAKDIPSLILRKNLFGLEIDDRAAQLAAFALMMKARADDQVLFRSGSTVQPQVRALLETKGLDAKEITDELNRPVLTQELPPTGKLFEEPGTLFTKAAMSVAGEIAPPDVAGLLALFENAKTFGSLIQVSKKLGDKLPELEERTRIVAAHGEGFNRVFAQQLLPSIEQAKLLARQYDCVVTNPPYMGGKYFDSVLKTFVGKHYKDARADLYACFMQRDAVFARPNGFVGMITIPNWMFLSAFESIRTELLTLRTIDTFIHNGRGAFGSDFGSGSFVFRNHELRAYNGIYKKLFDKQGSVSSNEELEQRLPGAESNLASSEDFALLPGQPIAYWTSKALRSSFQTLPPLLSTCTAKHGMSTSDNDRFLRLWHEVSVENVGWEYTNREQALLSRRTWFPFNKGGAFRRWYGNHDYVVNWRDDGSEIKAVSNLKYPYLKGNLDFVIGGQNYYFRPGITWSSISIASPSFRLSPPGFVIGNKGQCLFPHEDAETMTLLALLNSSLSTEFLAILSPSVGFELGYVQRIPVNTSVPRAGQIANELVQLSKADWDSVEQSWAFQVPPIVANRSSLLERSFIGSGDEYTQRFGRAKALEAENNRLFIEAYGLQNELSPEVPDDQITLYRPDRSEDIKRLLSYAIGCMMGRYSLDKPGLVYANAGNVGFDASQYMKFRADDDGIAPLTETDWGLPDDIARRFEEFISVAWPKEHLEENLAFVAESLDPKKGETTRETIRRYLATGFYKHHLQMYKRRPIYWLFSSGKLRAFQCLVYLHRYNEGTLARMRTEYVIPLQGRMAGRIDQLEAEKGKPTSTAHLKKIQKELDGLKKQETELRAFDEKLKHYADMKIPLDLDDGVKVNYGKFGDLLAEVKAVTGGSDE